MKKYFISCFAVLVLSSFVYANSDFNETLKSAKQGDAFAQFSLGYMHDEGEGTPQDYKKAYIWLSIASANDSKEAPPLRDRAAEKLTLTDIAAAQKTVAEYFEKYQW